MDRARFPCYGSGMTPVHHIFVDYENVQTVKLDLIAGKPVRVVIVVGRDQTKVPISLVEQLLRHSAQVRLIQTEVKGKNALDFVLSSEVGAEAVRDPDGRFHVVSRDKGFDALVAHLRSAGRDATRCDAFSKVSVLAGAPSGGGRQASASSTAAKAPAAAKKSAATGSRKRTAGSTRSGTLETIVERMTARLAADAANRPKRVRALRGLVKDRAGAEIAEADIDAVLDRLVADGVASVSDSGSVSYPA